MRRPPPIGRAAEVARPPARLAQYPHPVVCGLGRVYCGPRDHVAVLLAAAVPGLCEAGVKDPGYKF